MASFNLTDRVAIVTGGNGGIGLGMARGLAQAGADYCWSRSEEELCCGRRSARRRRPGAVARGARKPDEWDPPIAPYDPGGARHR